MKLNYNLITTKSLCNKEERIECKYDGNVNKLEVELEMERGKIHIMV